MVPKGVQVRFRGWFWGRKTGSGAGFGEGRAEKGVGWNLGSEVGRVECELRSVLGSILGVEYDYEVRFSRSDAYLLENRGFWFDFLRIHVDPGIFGGDFLESGFLENGWGGFWGWWWVG